MTFGFWTLGPLLPEFLARHPALQVELSLDDRVSTCSRRCRRRRAHRPAHRRPGRPPLPPPGPSLRPVPSLPSPAPARPWRRPISPGTTACATAPCRQPDDWSFSRGAERVTVRVAGNLQANTGDVLRAAARGGLGVVCLPDSIAGDDIGPASWSACWPTGPHPRRRSTPCSRRSATPRPSCAPSRLPGRAPGRRAWLARRLQPGRPPVGARLMSVAIRRPLARAGQPRDWRCLPPTGRPVPRLYQRRERRLAPQRNGRTRCCVGLPLSWSWSAWRSPP